MRTPSEHGMTLRIQWEKMVVNSLKNAFLKPQIEVIERKPVDFHHNARDHIDTILVALVGR